MGYSHILPTPRNKKSVCKPKLYTHEKCRTSFCYHTNFRTNLTENAKIEVCIFTKIKIQLRKICPYLVCVVCLLYQITLESASEFSVYKKLGILTPSLDALFRVLQIFYYDYVAKLLQLFFLFVTILIIGEGCDFFESYYKRKNYSY